MSIRGMYNFFYERSVDWMYDKKKDLQCRIRFLEDKLLRSKNIYKIEQLQADLYVLRTRLQKEMYKRSY